MQIYKFGIIDSERPALERVITTLKSIIDVNCLIAANTISEFWDELPERAQLNILFVDTELSDGSGIKQLAALRRRFPDATIVMFSNSSSQTDLMSALARGADGYLLKQDAMEGLSAQINTLRSGGALLSPRMARYLINQMNPPKKVVLEHNIALSNKELETLHLLSLGKSAEAIAEDMKISINGVKFHLKNIYSKMGVKNRVAAIRRYSEGWQQPQGQRVNNQVPMGRSAM